MCLTLSKILLQKPFWLYCHFDIIIHIHTKTLTTGLPESSIMFSMVSCMSSLLTLWRTSPSSSLFFFFCFLMIEPRCCFSCRPVLLLLLSLPQTLTMMLIMTMMVAIQTFLLSKLNLFSSRGFGFFATGLDLEACCSLPSIWARLKSWNFFLARNFTPRIVLFPS